MTYGIFFSILTKLFTHATYDRNADDADNADFHGFF